MGGLEALLAALVIIFLLRSYFAKPKLPHGVQLPPGPPSTPLLGNALAVDVSAPWVTYKTWGSQYGDMVYMRLFGQENIIINSEETARDLLEHRSQNYSDRPEIATIELLGVDYNTSFMRYNSRWRLQRKMLQQSFRQDVVFNFRSMQAGKTHELLLNLLEAPLEYPKHLHALAGSIIMSSVYSYEAARRDDYMVEDAAKAVQIITTEMRSKVTAIFCIFPSLLRLPSWLPGMRLKRIAPLAKELVVHFLDSSFAHTERGLATGSISSCMVVDHLLKLDESDSDFAWQKKAVKESAATALAAGVDTTASALMNFILAMILYPHVQEKAHDLIESVVGTNRLPTLQDRPSLLYVDAILRECLRWNPVIRLAIPHSTVDSDVYENYYIPKGTSVTANIWAMCHNEAKYPNPSEFNPERFLNADGTLTDDTVSVVWGFGRRICPGRHLAQASLWSAMVGLLTVFKFAKAKDENGKKIDIQPRWRAGLVVDPLPFPCSITARDAGLDMTALQHLVEVSV
ncbi:cytochrome P450 [Rhizopogon salebrosus TDB-379]|nr:cytochrome P450 [Rhizopogon salebrosus TDB-379]